jgi:ABC-type glutathione transport system ATPase component
LPVPFATSTSDCSAVGLRCDAKVRLELLESLLVDFTGTVLVVSHDRSFVNNVATSTLVIGPDGLVKEYDGGYDDYLRQLQSGSSSTSTTCSSR